MPNCDTNAINWLLTFVGSSCSAILFSHHISSHPHVSTLWPPKRNRIPVIENDITTWEATTTEQLPLKRDKFQWPLSMLSGGQNCSHFIKVCGGQQIVLNKSESVKINLFQAFSPASSSRLMMIRMIWATIKQIASRNDISSSSGLWWGSTERQTRNLKRRRLSSANNNKWCFAYFPSSSKAFLLQYTLPLSPTVSSQQRLKVE